MRNKSRKASAYFADIRLARATLVARQPGGLTAIAEAMTEIAHERGFSGDTYGRQEVFAWLHPDPATRVEPRLGVGELIDLAAKRVAKQAKKK